MRRIFTPETCALVENAEVNGGLGEIDAAKFIANVLEIFRWHDKANVDQELYERLHIAHRLIADVVSFRGPHINHLTPRTLDIDTIQADMPNHGIIPKAIVEGPPSRNCPILLRQTSFKALEEAIYFENSKGNWKVGSHTARFGEVGQRGIALTPKGRALFDRLLNEARARVRLDGDGANAVAYEKELKLVFFEFPDSWEVIRSQSLGYFRYSLSEKDSCLSADEIKGGIDFLVHAGMVQFDPIVYEDFLPVSAAGIFQSNLGVAGSQKFVDSPNQLNSEQNLGCAVHNEFELYAQIEKASIEACLSVVG